MIVFPDAILELMLNLLPSAAGSAGPLHGIKLKLYKNPLAPQPSNLLADFTEADYTGYAESAALTWSPAVGDGSGTWQLIGSPETWAPTGTTVPNTIYGVYAVDTAGTTLIFSEQFASPVPMAALTDSLTYLPVVRTSALSP